MLDQIVEVLTWDAGAGFAVELCTGHIEKLTAELRSALARLEASEPQRVGALMAKLRTCRPESVLRFLTAPETFAHMAGGVRRDQELLRFAEDSVQAELARERRLASSAGDFWTALGDRSYTCKSTPSTSLQLERGVRQSCRESYTAPDVRGLPVDLCSPRTSLIDIPITAPFGVFSPAARARLLKRLGRAVDGVQSVAPAALDVIRLFTRVIVARRSTTVARSFFSSSSPRYVGRTVLCDPDQASVEELAEALVHEAIHSMLCCVQLQQPFVVDHGKLSEPTVISPWTGNLLPADAFLEACFVWFGLSHFWRLASGSRVFRSDEVVRLRSRAYDGFYSSPLADRLVQLSHAFSTNVIPAIQAMQTMIRGHVLSEVG